MLTSGWRSSFKNVTGISERLEQARWGIGKENDFLDSNDGSTGRGILVQTKRRNAGPPPPPPPPLSDFIQ